MNPNALRALEFDHIVSVLSDLAVTPTGRNALEALHPSTETSEAVSTLRTTSEAVRFLGDHPGFPLRPPTDLEELLDALALEGRALEAPRLLAFADYLESIEHSRNAVTKLGSAFQLLRRVAEAAASFTDEISDVRRKVAPSGEVVDEASAALAGIRGRLRKQRARLRNTLESFLRGRETAKYLQEQVVTDRNGRYVLIVRAEHRSAIPGIVHGVSTTGASVFLEPLQTVEINNDIVALEEQEAEEVHRILLALTDAFRERPDDVQRTLDAGTELDMIQACGRLSLMMGGVEPVITDDGTFELRGARHPLMIAAVRERASELRDGGSPLQEASDLRPGAPDPVPVDILLTPPIHVLVIAGPNTGGKTVALKTAGLLAAMAQSGLHIPAEEGSRLPLFRSLFADIGDEQSISASLSTFSAHITNVVSMDRGLELPALVLLDEVGAGTDPVEGGALGTALIDHFRGRGAHLIATTHYDALKSYASITQGVAGAAFGFNPETFAPTYRLLYGSPGRSLAIEIAARLGMPQTVISRARENLTEPQKQLADHLARVDDDLRRLEEDRRSIARERALVAENEQRLRAREDSVAEREARLRRRTDAKLDDQLREARQQIDTVIDTLKARAAELSDRAAVRLNASGKVRSAGLSTGDIGALKTDARAALDQVADSVKEREAASGPGPGASSAPAEIGIEPGSRVTVGALGLEGVVIEVHDKHAEVDVRGKRLRAVLRDLRPISGSSARPTVRVSVELQPREGTLSELNLIGSTADEAMDRLDKFLDQVTVADVREFRIVHGHGTGQLRRTVASYLKDHPLVARFEPAPEKQGGGGATIVYLKD
jgi:DNA mismatch repair protein MutS2